MRTDCYNCAVSRFHITKHPSAPPLPPDLPCSRSPLCLFPFPPRSVLSSIPLFLFLALSRDRPSCFFYLLFPQPRRLNELRPHFVQLSVFVRHGPHFFPPPPPHSTPNCASISFKALITRPSSTLETPSSNVPPVQTNLISCFIRRDFCSDHQPYLMPLSWLRVGQRH